MTTNTFQSRKRSGVLKQALLAGKENNKAAVLGSWKCHWPPRTFGCEAPAPSERRAGSRAGSQAWAAACSSSRCCCSSSHHFAFSLSGSLCLPLALPRLQQHSALMHTFSTVSVPAAQKLTWLLSKHWDADKLKEKQEISPVVNECLF